MNNLTATSDRGISPPQARYEPSSSSSGRGIWPHPSPPPGMHLATSMLVLCVVGVAIGDIDLCFAWQAWHLQHWVGSGRTLGSGWSPFAPPHFAWHAAFVWQAWHVATSMLPLSGKSGTYSTGLALVAPLGRPWPVDRPWPGATLRGSPGTWRHPCGDILRFAWQACSFVRPTCVVQICGSHVWACLTFGHVLQKNLVTSTFVLRGRRSTYSTGLALAARLGPVGRPSPGATLRGSRGTWRHPCAFCVAGMALADIDLRFVWEWWPLVTTTCILRGRHGTYLGHVLFASNWLPVRLVAAMFKLTAALATP